MSDEVPGVVTCFSLNPAGTHRGRAIVDDLVAAKQAGAPIDDVVWDPGYSLCAPGTTHHKLAQAGIHQTFQIVTHQRGVRPFSGDALLLDGQLYSNLLPDDLRDLAVPPRGRRRRRSSSTRPSSICGPGGARFDTPDRTPTAPPGGGARSAPGCCGPGLSREPFVGRRPCRSYRSTKAARSAAPAFSRPCPPSFRWWQRLPFGTTAWRVSMGRRQVVESAYAAPKGTFADLNRGFFCVFGQTKMTFLLGFTIAGYNLDRIRSFRAKQRAMAEAKPKPAKRQRGTWNDIVEQTATPAEGTGAPPG